MSSSMRAIVIREAGDPSVLVMQERPRPEPGRGEVRVRVRGSGVNRADVLQRRGLYPAPPGVVADVPGLEFAGEVDLCGQGVVEWRPGDRVMGIAAGGAYAEYLVAHARELVRVPDTLDLLDAAAVPEAFMTAWDAMHRQGGLQAGQTVLIHAVASGVGTAALQLAHRSGAITIGTSRSVDKLERCRAMGLDAAIDPGAGDLARAIRAVAPDGVDLVLDLVGAAYLTTNVRSLRPGGTMVCVGLLGGASAELPLGLLLSRRVRLVGTVLRSRPLEEKIELAQRFAREIAPLFRPGGLAPVIDQVLPAEQAAEAHAQMESNQTFGKLVLHWTWR